MKKTFLIASSFSLSLLAASAFGADKDGGVFVTLSKKMVPSVVNISTYTTVKPQANRGGHPNDLFREFFEDFLRRRGMPDDGGEEGGEGDDGGGYPPPGPPMPGGKNPKSMSLGTGFIIDASGLILTNNHVVADADEIKINFTESFDEKPTDGEVVGRDPEIDIALIRVKTSRELVAVTLGDSDATEVGEYVAAIGNPFGQGHSVTHGIISAKGRLAPDFPLASYLQTDAPINPGNSGGPLVNLRGEVIGINNAIDQRAQGIGFAIPINVVKKVLPQLRSKGIVSRGYIGVLVHELDPDVAEKMGVSKDLRAPFVTHVYPGEPADKAGLKPYDVILEFAGKPVHTSAELINAVTSVNVGESTPVKILRSGKESSGKEMTLSIKVALRPGVPAQALPGKSGKPDKKSQSRVDTGMALDDVTPEVLRDLGITEKVSGVVVNSTSYGGAADQAGIMRGDIILEVDRKPVKSVEAFYAIVKEKKSYLIRVRRSDAQNHEAFAVVVLDLKSP